VEACCAVDLPLMCSYATAIGLGQRYTRYSILSHTHFVFATSSCFLHSTTVVHATFYLRTGSDASSLPLLVVDLRSRDHILVALLACGARSRNAQENMGAAITLAGVPCWVLPLSAGMVWLGMFHRIALPRIFITDVSSHTLTHDRLLGSDRLETISRDVR